MFLLFLIYQKCQKSFFTIVYIIYTTQSISKSSIEIKINLNFYFHTFWWCLTFWWWRFYDDLLRHHKEVWKQNFSLIFSLRPGWDGKG